MEKSHRPAWWPAGSRMLWWLRCRPGGSPRPRCPGPACSCPASSRPWSVGGEGESGNVQQKRLHYICMFFLIFGDLRGTCTPRRFSETLRLHQIRGRILQEEKHKKIILVFRGTVDASASCKNRSTNCRDNPSVHSEDCLVEVKAEPRIMLEVQSISITHGIALNYSFNHSRSIVYFSNHAPLDH